jgi:hypothetical protein
MASRAVDPSWVADRHCADINNGGRWLGGGVVEPGHARDRGGIDQGVEDGHGIEAAVHRLDRTGARATGRPGHGGARGGASCRRGTDMEEPATPGCSWTGAVGGQTSQGRGGRVSTGGL